MNKFRLHYFLIAIICLVSFTSCSDDDDADNVSPNIALLTGGEWSGNAVYADGRNVTNDFEEQVEIDWNLYTTVFERDGTYVEAYNGDTLVEGNWEYSNNERVIIFDRGTANEYSVVISQLTENEFWYVQSGYEYRFSR